MNKNNKDLKKTMPVWAQIVYITTIMVIIISAIFLVTEKSPDKKNIKNTVNVVYSDEEVLEKKIEQIVKKILQSSNSSEVGILKVGINRDVTNVNTLTYLVFIEYKTSDYTSKDFLLYNVIEFSKKIFNDPKFSKVSQYVLKPYMTLVDKYGHENEVNVASIPFKKSVADKINWDNIYADQFENILIEENESWFHVCLRD